MAIRGQQSETVEAAERSGMSPPVMASAGSVALSWYYFFVKGEKVKGLFVGLWPPTLLAFATHFEQKKTSDTLQRLTGSSSGVVESIERVVQGR